MSSILPDKENGSRVHLGRWCFIPILLAALVVTALPAIAQEEKPAAAVTPVAAIGKISDARKRVIFNRLETVLSRYFKLVSQEEYAEAEEAAFESLDADECTEENCIRAIQDFLQVDNLFSLQIIQEDEFTQLTLNMIRESDKVVLDDICEGCSIGQLHAKVEALVVQMMAGDPAAQPAVIAQPEMETINRSTWAMWTATTFAVAGLYYGLEAQSQADDANSKADSARANDDDAQFNEAEKDIADAKATGDIANILILIGGGLAIYYFNTGEEVPVTSANWRNGSPTIETPLILAATPSAVKIGWRWRW